MLKYPTKKTSVLRFLSVLLFAGLSVLLCACSSKPTDTEIILSEGSASVNGPKKNSVINNNGTVTITRDGNYNITGTGHWSIIVDVQSGKAVYLNLNNVDITCDNSAPIYVKNSSMVVINLMEGSQNFLTDRHIYVETDNGEGQYEGAEIPDAAIYSRAPLLFEGEGKLTIKADGYNGIASKDTLTIKSGNIKIDAAHHGIKGRDFVVISGGKLTIKCEGDAIKSTNSEEPSLGYINITGGDISADADDEGIYAASSITISGGTLLIDSKKAALYGNGSVQLKAGSIDIKANHEPILGKSIEASDNAMISINGRPYTKK